MNFELFDSVTIKDKRITGVIVDITIVDGVKVYTIESDDSGYTDDKDAYNGFHPLYDVTEDQLMKC